MHAAGGDHGGDVDVEVAVGVFGDKAVDDGGRDVGLCLEEGVEGDVERVVFVVVCC